MTNLRRGLSLAALLSFAAQVHAAGLDTHVTVEVSHVPLNMFLDSLSAQAKVNFIMTEGFEDKKVTAFLHDVSVREALDVLKETKDLDYRRLSDTNSYIVASKGSPALDPAVIGEDPALDVKVTVRVKNSPLDTFLNTVSGQTKVNFILDEGLEKMKVTAFLQNVTAREALEIVMAIKGLDCRRLDGHATYVMTKR